LKASGYPLDFIGVAQGVELVCQLRNEAGKRQVDSAETRILIIMEDLKIILYQF